MFPIRPQARLWTGSESGQEADMFSAFLLQKKCLSRISTCLREQRRFPKHSCLAESSVTRTRCSTTSFSRDVAVCRRLLFVSAGGQKLQSGVIFSPSFSGEPRPRFVRLISESLSVTTSSWRPDHLVKVTCMTERCSACRPHGLKPPQSRVTEGILSIGSSLGAAL